MPIKGKSNTLHSELVISIFLFIFFNITLAYGQLCSIKINIENKSDERTVYLSGGKAWNLFQTYLKELENNNIKASPRKIRVVIWDGKAIKEFGMSWRDLLTGQGAKERWESRLRNIDAVIHEPTLNNATRQKWDVICIPSGSTPIEPSGPSNSNQPDSSSKMEQNTKKSIPVEAKLNLQQGMNYVKLRDFDNAIKEFTLAIEKYPKYAEAYSNRAIAYMQQKKFNKAADDLKKASEISPNDRFVYYNLGALYSIRNQLDLALDSVDKCLELGFSDYDALRKDPDLKNVRNHPEFRKVLEKHKVFLK